MFERWTLIFYRAPAQPSSARVATWRRLHRLGALYLGPSSCALPARLEAEGDLGKIAANLREAGGSFESLTVEQFSSESEQRLAALYNAARDAEYDELIERAEAVIAELEREGQKDKFIFAEVEENEADLTRLRRWASRVRWRDVYRASRRDAAEAAVRAAQERLDAFVRIATERDSPLPESEDRLTRGPPSTMPSSSSSEPRPMAATDASQPLRELGERKPRGLSSAEAATRLAEAGPNTVVRKDGEPIWREFVEAAGEPLQLLLLAVAVLYAILGELRDAAIIFGVIVTVAVVETTTEHRAGRAIAALSRLSAPRALVWRDGSLIEIAPEGLVPGDEIVVSAGSLVPADARLLEAEELLVDESLVTGESQPVEHGLGEGDYGQLKSGTHVVRGRAVATVTAVGAASTLGRIAALVGEAESPKTPLQRQMAELARGLLVAALVVSAIVPLVGVLRGQPWHVMVLTGLTLAFATIPEELPILVVLVLGLGSLRLARRGAIVRRLIAAETLGSTTLVCTDKTGTLTENRMTLTRVLVTSEILGLPAAPDGASERVRRLARLASEPPAGDGARFVDPMDVAVWRASGAGWPDAEARFSFDGARRLASGWTRVDGHRLLGVKGAPEVVVERSGARAESAGAEPLSPAVRAELLTAAGRLAASGGRVLAVASRSLDGIADRSDRDQVERDLVFQGLLLFSDPLRAEVPDAVRELTGAGVAVTVVTGDQAATAGAIARSAGLNGPVFVTAETDGWNDEELAARAAEGCVFARARPEDKLRIVNAATAAGQVVAVTGDGVNDAPALKAAAIGVAMGRGGSDVAREAGDLVLTDDNFATLARATAEGRRLYDNLRKAVRYYLAIKLALVSVSLVAAVSGLPLPFTPVQIVILELFMDLGASVAFVHQAAEDDLMRRPPRDPKARFLNRSMLVGIVAGGLTLAVLSGGAFLIALPSLGVDSARTLALVAWFVGNAVLGVVMGWERRPVVARDLLANRSMLAWIAASGTFALALLTVPPFAGLLHAGAVPLVAGLLAAGAAVVLPLWMEVAKRMARW